MTPEDAGLSEAEPTTPLPRHMIEQTVKQSYEEVINIALFSMDELL